MPLIKNIFRPIVRNSAELRRYVGSVTLFAWVVALFADVSQHALAFVSWTNLLAQSALSTVVVVVVAVPVARTMGRAHLELHHAKAEAERLGRVDPLTGLVNRRGFYEAAQGLDGAALALVIADIDRFKRINDSFGHAAGDEVIKAVAQTMQAELGDLGTVARVGGEEFAFLGARVAAEALNARLARFRQRVAGEAILVGGRPVFVTVSAGVAALQGVDFDTLYAAADKALYFAKSAGRDRIVDVEEMVEIEPATFARAS